MIRAQLIGTSVGFAILGFWMLWMLSGCRHDEARVRGDALEAARVSDNARATHVIRRGGIDLQHAHNWRVVVKMERFHKPLGVTGNWKPTPQQIASGAVKPYETLYAEGNVLCTAGITRLGNRLIGTGSTTAYDISNTRFCVGDGTTAVAAGDTDLSALSGATHRFYALVDQTPTVSTNVITWHATIGTADGDFHQQEWGIDNGTASGSGTITAPLLNHKLTDFGTKTSSASNAYTITLTIS